MRNLFTALAYIAFFFGGIAGALFFTWLLVEFQYGAIEVAEFQSGIPMTSQTFMTYMCLTMAASCMMMSFMTLRMLDRRTA